MLNFQIRGAGVEYYLSGIDDANKKKILKDISNNKLSLAQIMINENWRIADNIYEIKAPMIKKDSELIITSIDSNDYYNDGYSFFREKLFDSSKFSVDEEIDISEVSNAIINYAIFYGSIFEAELDDLNHEYFDASILSIDTIGCPFLEIDLACGVYVENLELLDLGREKKEMIKFGSIMYKKKLLSTNKISISELDDAFETVINSEIIFRK